MKKAKKQLEEELAGLRRKVSELEGRQIRGTPCNKDLRVMNNALESSITAIAFADPEGNITYVNPSFLGLWGYEDRDEVIARPAVGFWQSEEKAREVIDRLYAEGSWAGELVAMRKDGTFFDAQVSAGIVKGEEGKPVCMMASFVDVTAFRRSERDLLESKKLQQRVFDDAAIGMALVGTDGTFLQVNGAMCAMLGYSRAELAGKTFQDFTRDEDKQISMEVLRDLLSGKLDKARFEKRYRHKDGHTVWVAIFTKPLFDDEGRPLYFVTQMEDITERKFADANLRTERQRLFDLLNSMPVLVYLQAPDHTIRFANRYFIEKYGDPGSRPCHEVIWGRAEPCEECPTFRVFDTREPAVWISEHGPGGEVFKVYDYPFKDTDGSPLVLEVSLNITDLKRANEALSRSEALHRVLVQTIPHGVQENDTSGVITFSNPAHARILGYGEGELVGKHIWGFLDAEKEREKLRRYLERLVREEPPPTPYFTRNRTRDGRLIDVQVDWNYKRDETGEVVGFVSVITDITERKRAEEEKERLMTQLMQSQKMEAIGVLAGGIAHDFNNIMTVIMNLTGLALNKVEENDPMKKYLEPLRDTTERATNLVQQLLIFSHNKPVELVSFNLNETIDDTLGLLKSLVSEDISIENDLEYELWDIMADKGRIEQVLTNLIINSSDAMPRGGRITIGTRNVHITKEQSRTVHGATPGNFVCLTVEDTGTGMDHETVRHIFEPFFTTKSPRGTGLGLSVVYGIVNDLKGWIDVASEPGMGSSFKVYIPASTEGKEAGEKMPDKRPAAEGGGKRVLLVEDDKWVRKSTAMALAENGYVVFEAANAENAISRFYREKGRFDLVLSDVVMPGKSGLQMLDSLLDINPRIPILLFSGHLDDRAQMKEIIKKGVAFIHKPYDIQDLLKAVEETIDQSS